MISPFRNLSLWLILFVVGCSADPSDVSKYKNTLTRTIQIKAEKVNYSLSPGISQIAGNDSLYFHSSVSTFNLAELDLPAGYIDKITVTGIRAKVIGTNRPVTTRIPLQFNNCGDGSCSVWTMFLKPVVGVEQGFDFTYADQKDIGKAFHSNNSLDMRLGFSFSRSEIPSELTFEVTLNVIAGVFSE